MVKICRLRGKQIGVIRRPVEPPRTDDFIFGTARTSPGLELFFLLK